MAVSNKDKHKEYSRYAATCLEMLIAVADQEARDVHTEMAAEWIRLAEAIVGRYQRRSSRPSQSVTLAFRSSRF
jgi:hypothetical protein